MKSKTMLLPFMIYGLFIYVCSMPLLINCFIPPDAIYSHVPARIARPAPSYFHDLLFSIPGVLGFIFSIVTVGRILGMINLRYAPTAAICLGDLLIRVLFIAPLIYLQIVMPTTLFQAILMNLFVTLPLLIGGLTDLLLLKFHAVSPS